MYNYSLISFGQMIGPANKTRVEAYAHSLAQTINPDSVVLEIGTGFGFFALLACQYGARHVYAIEANEPVLRVAREIAADNGFSERITFIAGNSNDITLPEPADILISDMRGALPWLADHIPSIVDARRRLLKPGSVLIPGKDTVWAAVVEAPNHYSRYTDAWDKNQYGLDLQAARRYTMNGSGKARVTPEQLLTTPLCWSTLDYYTITNPNAKDEISWHVEREGTAHGLSLWFATELIPGISYSNAPDQPFIPIYSQMFYPWLQPVDLLVGDQVVVNLQGTRIENKYEWLWATNITGQNGVQKVSFRQSTFQGRLLPANILREMGT